MASPSYHSAGIVSTADQSEATYLPLDSLDVHVFIADVSARVILSQVYSHHGSDMLPEAFYVFPVPARAAVCSFEMRTNNGIRLKGAVKELSQAKAEYRKALSEGWLSGLLEQFRQDGKAASMPKPASRSPPLLLETPWLGLGNLFISSQYMFVVSIGSMPPHTNVTVLLSYVVDLSEDDQPNTVRFQLSSHVRARYGAPPNSILYQEKTHRALLNIIVDIEMPGPILSTKSLNHNPFLDAPLDTSAQADSDPGGQRRHFLRKQFSSGTMFDLRADFLLVVHAVGLDRPHCFAEQLFRQENSRHSLDGPTTALALTIVPRFDLQIELPQEYIFLIDRSGSMSGRNIIMAKKALVLILGGLSFPTTIFNVHSFGSNRSSLWTESRPYTDINVAAAISHVEYMDANMGGTELLSALMWILQGRRRDMATNLFVLTDGEVYDVDTLVERVRNAVSNAPVTAPIRVFTLGVGSGASTALCQRLASVGNGSNLMTVDGEDLATKAKRLVKAMQTPQVRNMSIDWGVADEVLQAPQRIAALSPGMRLLVTAIIKGEQWPTQVTLRLNLLDGSSYNYQVDVRRLSHRVPLAFRTIDPPPLLHTLSAHLLIQDVEGGDPQTLAFHNWDRLSPGTRRDVIKNFIVEFGTRYQVASSHTAFVAVAAPPRQKHGSNLRPPGSRSANNNHRRSSKTDSTPSSLDQQKSGQRNGSTPGSHSENGEKSEPKGSTTSPAGNSTKNTKSPPDTHPLKEPRGAVKSSLSPRGSARGSVTNGSKGPASEVDSKSGSHSESPMMPGGYRWPQSPNVRTIGTGTQFDFFAHNPPGNPAEEVLCFPNPLGDNFAIFTALPPAHHTTITMVPTPWLKSLQSFVFRGKKFSGMRGGLMTKAVSAFPTMGRNMALPDQIVSIVKLQGTDGSFSHGLSGLSTIVGISESRLRDSMTSGPCSELAWAAAIAVAFFRKKFSVNLELWNDIAEKATRFASKMCGGDELFEDMVQEAVKLF